jgi:hypothetical protein
MNIHAFLKKIQESESYRKFKKEMDEISTTGMVAGYQTPKAFSPKSGEAKEEFDEKRKENAEQFGFEIVPKQKRKHSISYETYVERGIKKPIGKNEGKSYKKESAYKQVMNSLLEASYKEYRGDKTKSTNEKINNSIKELNQSLMKVEQAVGHALRLKTEMAVDQRLLWRSSHNRLTKIGERLNRIGKKINELGA